MRRRRYEAYVTKDYLNNFPEEEGNVKQSNPTT